MGLEVLSSSLMGVLILVLKCFMRFPSAPVRDFLENEVSFFSTVFEEESEFCIHLPIPFLFFVCFFSKMSSVKAQNLACSLMILSVFN